MAAREQHSTVVSWLMRLVGKEHWSAVLFALRINIFSLALLGFWTPLNNLMLPDQVSQLVPEFLKGSALGLITFLGIGIATIVQPIAGRIDDRIALPHRRKAFIAGGSAAGVLGVLLFSLAPAFIWLLLAYIVMQIAVNVAQAAFQALIPDLIKPDGRGLASGIKDGLGVLGAALGVVGVGLLVNLLWGKYLALAYLALLLGGTAYLSLRWVPDVPPPPDDERIHNLRDIQVAAMFRSFAAAFKANRVFRLAVVARFLFLLGLYPVERLFLYYLENRFHVTSLSHVSVFLVAAI
ncbi:MAG TPA: MFS transporter, partial [Thermomicrobiaceae bacterium]|nr:MFS transporter [Thermomicrobiaceae bacterium]